MFQLNLIDIIKLVISGIFTNNFMHPKYNSTPVNDPLIYNSPLIYIRIFPNLRILLQYKLNYYNTVKNNIQTNKKQITHKHCLYLFL